MSRGHLVNTAKQPFSAGIRRDLGYHFGITGAGSFWITLVLALSFSAVILLIADLDRPVGGLVYVSQEPMVDLQHKLRSPGE